MSDVFPVRVLIKISLVFQHREKLFLAVLFFETYCIVAYDKPKLSVIMTNQDLFADLFTSSVLFLMCFLIA